MPFRFYVLFSFTLIFLEDFRKNPHVLKICKRAILMKSFSVSIEHLYVPNFRETRSVLLVLKRAIMTVPFRIYV